MNEERENSLGKEIEKITFEKFLKECILESTAPHFPEPENPFYDAGSNEHLMNDHMLF